MICAPWRTNASARPQPAAPPRRRPRAVALLGAVILAVAASACSSGTTTSGGSTTAGSATTTTISRQQVTEAQQTASSAVDKAQQTASSLLQGATTTDAASARAELASTLRSNGLTTAATLVETVDFSQVFGTGPFTFFAPNDEAFRSLGAAAAADLAANPTKGIQALKTHVVHERIDSSALAGRSSVTTASGASLPVVKTGSTITVGGATVVKPDIKAGNGVVHVIDKVLTP